jgi:hypothetical protein
MELIGHLRETKMIRFLTKLDEHGWVMARAVLAELARRSPPKQKPTEESNEWR